MPSPLVYYASVVSTKDPRKLGRVQVKLRGFPADVEMADVWLRMLNPAAGVSTGFVFLPEVGDEVAVLRGVEDNVDAFLILGSVYNGTNKPIYSNADGDNITKEIRTKAGNTVTFTDKSGEEAITISTAGAKITISMENKSNGLVTISGADKVKITCTTELAIESETVKIDASKSLELGSGTAVKVKGGTVNVEGTTVEVKGSTEAKIAAPQIAIG